MTVFRLFLIMGLLVLANPLSAEAAESNARKSTANGVTVAVTPDLRGAQTWEFKIVLDTHTQDLSDDLLKTAVLLDPRGNRHLPTAWEGAPAGGHHREGVLRFAAIAPMPAYVELEIRRPKEPAPRVFRWQLQ